MYQSALHADWNKHSSLKIIHMYWLIAIYKMIEIWILVFAFCIFGFVHRIGLLWFSLSFTVHVKSVDVYEISIINFMYFMVRKAINCTILIERMFSMCYKIGILKILQINFDAYVYMCAFLFVYMENMWMCLCLKCIHHILKQERRITIA